MVTEQNKSIVQSAKQLKIKLSTAKLILKKFKETGTFFDKKMPDYCRRTPRYQLSQHQNDLPPKLEEQSHNLPISGSPQRNG
jgi:transposase